MIHIDSAEFVGPRAYFTAFDHRIVSRATDLKELRQNVERKLKLLLLVKSNIVCAASHLTTDFALSFFKDNPNLLRAGCVIPALRKDKHGFEQLFDRKEKKNKTEFVNFYDDNVKQVVDWELKENAEWFRDRYVEELQKVDSPLRNSLRGLNDDDLTRIILTISEADILSRQLIEDVSQPLTRQLQEVLLNYRELLYHISGARVVNCESCLPQENFIDYDLADISQQRMRLSDDQILWKLVIEIALESLQRRMIPMELLDLLSFDDILKIRIPLMESGFQSKYDELTRLSVPESEDLNDSQLFELNELERIRSNLEDTFSAVFEKELPHYLKSKAMSNFKTLGGVGSSVALSLAGMIPGYGIAFGLASVLKETPSLIMNLTKVGLSIDSMKSIESYVKRRNVAVGKIAEKASIKDKSLLLDMVGALSNVIAERMRL